MKFASLETFRIPSRMLSIWADKVGQEMSILAQHAVLAGRLFEDGNLIVSGAPGSGKSFVAEMAAFSAASRGRVALLARDHHAASELLAHVVDRYGVLGLRIVGDDRISGTNREDIRRGRFDVLVSSPENLSALCARSPAVLGGLRSVVFDDPYLLGKACGRVELLLTKLRDTLSASPRIVVTTSAQGGLVEAARWLGATLISHQEREHELRRGVLFEGTLRYYDTGTGKRGQETIHPRVKAEPLSLLAEAAEALLDKGETVAVFVADEASAVEVARRLSPCRRPSERSPAWTALQSLEPTSKQVVLADLLPRGLAVLHEELTGEEIDVVRCAFARHEITCVVATHGMARRLTIPVSNVLMQGQRWERTKEDDWRLKNLVRAETDLLASWARRPARDGDHSRAAIVATSLVDQESFDELVITREGPALTGKLDAHHLEEIALSLVTSGAARTPAQIVSVLSSTFSGEALWKTRRAQAALADRLELALGACHAGDLLAFGPGNTLVATPVGRVTVTRDLGLASAAEVALWNKEHPGEVLSDIELLAQLAALPAGRQFPLRRPSASPPASRFSHTLLERARARSQSLRPVFSRLSQARWLDAQTEEWCGLALLLLDWIDEVPLREIERRYTMGAGGILRIARYFAGLCDGLAEIRAESRASQDELAEIALLAARLRSGVRRDAFFLLDIYQGPREREVITRLRAHGLLNADRLRVASPEELFAAIRDQRLTNAAWASLHPDLRLPKAALSTVPAGMNGEGEAVLIPALQARGPEREARTSGTALLDKGDEAPTEPWLPKQESEPTPTAVPAVPQAKRLRLVVKNAEICIDGGPPFVIPRVQFLVLLALAKWPERAFTSEALREAVVDLDAMEDVPAMSRIRQLRYRISQSVEKHIGAELALTLFAHPGPGRLQLGEGWQIEIVG